MTTQHPAAPETETDANGRLTADERDALAAGWPDFWQVHAAVERIVAERVRVVEGERDAAPTGAAAIGRVLDLEGQVDLARARAESAEAAHEAEKAAHERLRAGVEALADEWEAGFFAFRHQDPAHLKIRALLGGGEAR